MSVGNISFTADSSAFLCAVCQEKQSKQDCEIRWAHKQNNGKWQLDTLTKVLPNFMANYQSMPHLNSVNGEQILFFSANSPDANGGLDIYCATKQANGSFTEIRAIKAIALKMN
jgi:hypothetical protein